MPLPNPNLCPINIRESLLAYAMEGRETGGFLQAVISNELYQAVQSADEINLPLIPHILAWMVANLPANVWGSRQAMQRHIERKARERRKAEMVAKETL